MARLAKFAHEQIVDATARMAADAGPAQVTMARLAESLQAPTGSIYHRFPSRDVLLGEVWLRAAETFQRAFGALLEGGDAWAAGLAATLFVPARVRREPAEARILLLHRREDFMADGWPEAMSARAAELKRRADAGLRDLSRRLLGRADASALRTVRFALVDAPLAAVLPHLRAGENPPATVESLLQTTYEAVMTQAGAIATRATTRKGKS